MNKTRKICLIILITILSISPLSSSATSYKRIMNSPTATKQQIKVWAEKNNASDLYISLIDIGYDIAVKYEIDPTVMLAQTALETNYGKFGGVIDKSYHNTAGIKTSNGGGNYDKKAHQKFNSWEDGFEAQAQHLRLYVGYCHHYREDCPHEIPVIVDPRHFKEISGKAVYVSELSKAWASDDTYGNKINAMCNDIINTKVDKIKEKEESKNTTKEVKELSPIERIKARVLKGRSEEKINYIKDLLFNKEKENLMKEYIKNKMR